MVNFKKPSRGTSRQSDGREFGCCDGKEQVLISVEIVPPEVIVVNGIVQVAFASVFGASALAEPNGSGAVVVIVQTFVARAVSSFAPAHRSRSLSLHVYFLTLWIEPLFFQVTQIAILAKPSPSESNR